MDMSILKELPLKPVGFTRKMTMHINFGNDGGMGTYDCFFPDGKLAPFRYQYDTRKGGLTGFFLDNFEGVMSWSELVFKYQDYVKDKFEVTDEALEDTQ